MIVFYVLILTYQRFPPKSSRIWPLPAASTPASISPQRTDGTDGTNGTYEKAVFGGASTEGVLGGNGRNTLGRRSGLGECGIFFAFLKIAITVLK
jgi:hypothetical protein